jgi:hypothetical protein
MMLRPFDKLRAQHEVLSGLHPELVEGQICQKNNQKNNTIHSVIALVIALNHIHFSHQR